MPIRDVRWLGVLFTWVMLLLPAAGPQKTFEPRCELGSANLEVSEPAGVGTTKPFGIQDPAQRGVQRETV